jgi:hypothetical protein
MKIKCNEDKTKTMRDTHESSKAHYSDVHSEELE